MIDSAYLVFTDKGLKRMVKGTRRGRHRQRPSLNRGEFAVLVTVNVPAAAFKMPPIAEATVTVPEASVVMPAPAVVITFPDATASS